MDQINLSMTMQLGTDGNYRVTSTAWDVTPNRKIPAAPPMSGKLPPMVWVISGDEIGEGKNFEVIKIFESEADGRAYMDLFFKNHSEIKFEGIPVTPKGCYAGMLIPKPKI